MSSNTTFNISNRTFENNAFNQANIRDTVEANNEEEMYVITRTGKKELLDTNQITNRLRNLINRKPKIPHVNPYELMLEVSKGLKSGINTYEIDEYAANASASVSINNPFYIKVAARIAIDNHQKNTMRSFVDKMRKAYLYTDDKGKICPLLSTEFFKYVEENQDEIEKMLDYSKDFLLDFFGFRTFQTNYSLKINGTPIERPQDLFMRTAITLHMNTSNIKKELNNIKITYDLLSSKDYSHASPTYYNAGGVRQQLASCFLIGSNDSRKGIMHTVDTMSKISKWAGGIGVHVNGWRGTGARIRSTNGRSSGIVPFLKHYETCLNAFNQGGRRNGSGAVYLMPHHPDIMEFIELPRNAGEEKQRARDLFYALWIPDLFMERVAAGEMWSLFDPDQTEDLSNYWGDTYKSKYLALEKQKLYTKQLPARTIWEAVKETNDDRGFHFICFSDNANRMFTQSNIGVLKSSNLCTEIFIYSDDKEYGVCVLSSMSLPNYVLDGYSKEELEMPEDQRRELNHEYPVNPYFDFRKFIDAVKVVCNNLNIIVDKTYQPTKETRRGNERHRPIGIGCQGLDDCYAKMRYPFKSDEARKLNKHIFEALYFAALTQSSILAKNDYMKLRKKCKEEGKVTVTIFKPTDYKKYVVTFTNPDDIPHKIGAYPSIEWNGGSPYNKGIFHWEMYGLKKEQLSGMFDWESLREHILKFGLKNSLLTAIMPTASTSQLFGNSECIEPYTSNVYKRTTLAGEYIVIKKYLMNDLYNLGLWSPTVKDYIMCNSGSIQDIEGIPEEIKQLYPTVLEIGTTELIQQAIDRQPFIDQGQSLNWYCSNMSKKEWNENLFKAWRGGLKTGKYYTRSTPAVMPQKFTLDPKKQEEMRLLLEKNKHGTAHVPAMQEVCDVCSA
jgi:ribonucleoside-diphosphate reductase alpha chain